MHRGYETETYSLNRSENRLPEIFQRQRRENLA